jgi:hypothetical protein
MEAYRGNRAALEAWHTREDMDLMDWVAVATLREKHWWETPEMTCIHEAVAARATADAQADTAVEAAR